MFLLNAMHYLVVFEFAALFSVLFFVLISAAVTVSTKKAEFDWLGEAQFMYN